MSRPSWARKYGEALADVAQESGATARVKTELDSFARLLGQQQELREALVSPAVPLVPRKNILIEIGKRLNWSSVTRNFLLVLVEKGRIERFDLLLLAYRDVLDERAGMIRAEVVSARPLDESSQDQLEATVAEMTGKKARLKYRVEDGLIGGLRLKIGSTVYDGTVRSQLEQVRKELIGT